MHCCKHKQILAYRNASEHKQWGLVREIKSPSCSCKCSTPWSSFRIFNGRDSGIDIGSLCMTAPVHKVWGNASSEFGSRVSRTCLARKGNSDTNRLGSWSAARNNERLASRSLTACKTFTNRMPIADFVSAFGLHRISIFCASGKTFRRRVFDALGGTRNSCLLGELFCPTSPRRPAMRPDPRRPLYVKVLDSTSFLNC